MESPLPRARGRGPARRAAWILHLLSDDASPMAHEVPVPDLIEATIRDSAAGEERRDRYDRRRTTWRTFVRGAITPRRRNARRNDEQTNLVDWHEPHLLALSMMILLLSVMDAFLTLTLIMRGATEVNPVMAFVLQDFPELFAAVKMTLTGGGVVVLVVLARARVFRVVRVGALMHWFLVGYLALIAYEWWLLRSIL